MKVIEFVPLAGDPIGDRRTLYLSTNDIRRDHTGLKGELTKADAAAQRFPAAIRAAPVPTVILDPQDADGRIIFANDAFCRLTGYSSEKLVDRSCCFLQGPETDPEAVARIRAAIRAAEPIDLLVRYYRWNRMAFWDRLLIAPAKDDAGTVLYLVANHIDVTVEQEKIEGLESHNAVMALFGERLTRQMRALKKANSVLKAEIQERDLSCALAE